MKIKEWIILGLLISVAASSRGLGETRDHAKDSAKDSKESVVVTKDNIIESLDKIESALLVLQSSKKTPGAGEVSWTELENFQSLVWRAMALDPGPHSNVPVSQVPKNLFAAELNAELSRSLTELKKSPIPNTFRALAEFNEYIKIVENIINLRNTRSFPQARAIAKRGTLENAYLKLSKKVTVSIEGGGPVNLSSLIVTVQAMKAYAAAPTTARDGRDHQKKEVFGNGNQFVWYAIAAVFGFFIGIAGYRMNPDFFQNFLSEVNSGSHTGSLSGSMPATSTTRNAAQKLDYARWLKEFEEILTRLKSSQLTHERRIEDVVQNSEKISQQANSLYSDARIKNEANLEYRMSALVREIQQQFEQGQRLQSGDRVQVKMILEHCLRLCDAVESNSLHVELDRRSEPVLRNVG